MKTLEKTMAVIAEELKEANRLKKLEIAEQKIQNKLHAIKITRDIGTEVPNVPMLPSVEQYPYYIESAMNLIKEIS